MTAAQWCIEPDRLSRFLGSADVEHCDKFGGPRNRPPGVASEGGRMGEALAPPGGAALEAPLDALVANFRGGPLLFAAPNGDRPPGGAGAHRFPLSFSAPC